MKITTKKEMYTLYERGMFGNKLRTWDPFTTAYGRLKDEDKVCVRYKKPGNKWTLFNVSFLDAVRAIGKFVIEEGAKVELFTLNEVGQDEKIILQGEVMHSVRGIELTYSQQPSIMHRHAMKQAKHADGLEAVCYLRALLSNDSYEDLMALLDTYEDAVIEFTAYAVDVGTCKWRNTVVWEVRNY